MSSADRRWILAANSDAPERSFHGTLLQSFCRTTSLRSVHPYTSTRKAELQQWNGSHPSSIVEPCCSAAESLLAGGVWLHHLSSLTHCCANSCVLLRAHARDYLDSAAIRGLIPLHIRLGGLQRRRVLYLAPALPCGALRWTARYGILIDGTEIAIVEYNAYHHLMRARNGFNENHSVGAEHESLTSLSCCQRETETIDQQLVVNADTEAVNGSEIACGQCDRLNYVMRTSKLSTDTFQG